MTKQSELREIVSGLCDVESGLTAWECDFVSDMMDWQGPYTEKQEVCIQEIWDRVIV